jgi:hypothetical protein
MKSLCKIIIVFTIFVACKQTSTQREEADSTKLGDTLSFMEPEEDFRNASCIFAKTEKTRRSTAPFDKADYIELVSYPARLEDSDTLIKDGKFMVKEIKERIRLNKKQTDSLFSILHDHRMKIKGAPVAYPACYAPRHAILFYKDKKPFAFLEICFSCGGTRQTRGIDFGEFCLEKLLLLHQFFITSGIKFKI